MNQAIYAEIEVLFMSDLFSEDQEECISQVIAPLVAMYLLSNPDANTIRTLVQLLSLHMATCLDQIFNLTNQASTSMACNCLLVGLWYTNEELRAIMRAYLQTLSEEQMNGGIYEKI